MVLPVERALPKQENEYDFYLHTPLWANIAKQNNKPCLEVRMRFSDPKAVGCIVKEILDKGHVNLKAKFKEENTFIVITKLKNAGLLPNDIKATKED